MESIKTTLLDALLEKNVVKFGEYYLKSGQKSPIYIDLRGLISSPNILSLAAEALCSKIKELNIEFDYVVGVPYAALPLATLVCDRLQKPMLMRRKYAKSYGTKKLIEGEYKNGGKCLIVEDVVVHGDSIAETVKVLNDEGLKCIEAIAVLDRMQGGSENLKNNGVRLSSVLTLECLLNYMISKKLIDEEKKKYIFDELAKPFISVEQH
uniref:Uridine 5'-monophosphate synthase n=1 Tax=Parastrongyloides trichosuri TaxID=131310 RepID=A0A0N4ZTC8_PARTI